MEYEVVSEKENRGVQGNMHQDRGGGGTGFFPYEAEQNPRGTGGYHPDRGTVGRSEEERIQQDGAGLRQETQELFIDQAPVDDLLREGTEDTQQQKSRNTGGQVRRFPEAEPAQGAAGGTGQHAQQDAREG